jgi:hypothetical protein
MKDTYSVDTENSACDVLSIYLSRRQTEILTYCYETKRQVCDRDVCQYPDVIPLSDRRLTVSQSCLAVFDIRDC